MITIGRMAEKYHMLPHQIEQNATTYDFMIMDVLATYDNYQQQKSSGKIDPKAYNYNTEQLIKIMGKKNGK